MRFAEHRKRAGESAPPQNDLVAEAGRLADHFVLASGEESLPAVLLSAGHTEPSASIAATRLALGRLLARHGALLLRGLAIVDAAGFERAIRAFSGELMDYRENTSPRSQVRGRIHTSTDHPAAERIVLHNEHSYSRIVPLRLFLLCATPAREGGATPLADCRRVLARIPSRIIARFQERGWLYVRNFVEGFGPEWQTVYRVHDRAALEAHCRNAGIEWEWTDRGHLRTAIRRTAVAIHPRTGEPVWFNHIMFWHITSLAPEMQALLRREFAAPDLPNNTYCGDGSPIEDDVIEEIRAAYDAETREFAWQAGDLLLVDNMLAAHGRGAFTGPRRVLFAMAEPVDRAAAPDWRVP